MRTTLRTLRLLSGLSTLALLATACGGGSGGGGTSTGTAALAGSIILRDGSTANLAGIQITFPRTGQKATSGSDGRFTFGAVPSGTLSLRVKDPLVAASVPAASVATVATQQGGADDASSQDAADDADDDQGDDATNDDANDDGDDHDTGDADMDVTGVSDGETVDVRIAIRNGVIESIRVSTSGHGNCEAESRLSRASTSDDADIEGEARLQNRTDFQRIKVKVEHASVGRSLEVFVIATDLSTASLGKVVVDANGRAAWEINTAHGDALPFGAATVVDLAGDGVEVRDGDSGLVLLFGTLENTPPSAGDHGSEHHGAGHLTAAVGVTGEARVEAVHRADQNREKFKVELDHRSALEAFDVWLENPASLGTFTKIGTIVIGSEGEGELEYDTHDGDSLPYGVAQVAALVGLQVEIRTGSTVLFSGTVPSLVND